MRSCVSEKREERREKKENNRRVVRVARGRYFALKVPDRAVSPLGKNDGIDNCEGGPCMNNHGTMKFDRTSRHFSVITKI